jgi:deazaflavin-dependent oxidoreductase (nitroreductase family)
MREELKGALDRGGIADITTTGRKSGEPRRIEIYFHQFDGQYYLTGRPGRRRDWEANIKANPQFTLHLKRGVIEDVRAVGESEPDPEVRRAILLRARVENWDSDPERAEASVHKWVEGSPFFRFHPIPNSG